MGFSSLNQRSKLGLMGEEEEEEEAEAEAAVGHLDFTISSSSEEISSHGSLSSLESESDEVASPVSSSSSSSSPPSKDPLQNMSSLLQQPPFKRGLSKHYKGKSQSFTSLSNVTSLEDLPKTQIPCQNKKLKYCKSYASGLADHTYDKKASRPLCSSLINCSKRNSSSHASFLGSSRPPIPPHRSSSTASFSTQTALIA